MMTRLEEKREIPNGLAHDLNNALAPILLASRIMRMGRLDEEAQKMLEMIDACVQRSVDIVRQAFPTASRDLAKTARQTRNVVVHS